MNVILGITGSIAAFKAIDILRLLKQRDIDVRVVLTSGAKQFVTEQTLQALSNNPVRSELFDLNSELQIDHIELAKWADCILIAPASADIMAKLAHGLADNLLTTLCLASKAPIFIAPAMNQQMWRAQATQENKQILLQRAVHIIGPDEGEQACGDIGPGRMSEASDIVEAVLDASLSELIDSRLLKGRTVMVTAGPTQEAIDPVRYISNHSSGKMGYSIARAAHLAGAEVILVSGPVKLPVDFLRDLSSVHIEQVLSAQDMLEAVKSNLDKTDIFISCAAVADYRPINIAENKIKKSSEEIELKLIKNPDIIHQVALSQKVDYVVGFAAETQQLLHNAEGKLKAKQIDMIVANPVAFNDDGTTTGFNSDDNELHLLWLEKEENGSVSSKAKDKGSTKINSKVFDKAEKKYLAIELVKEINKQYKLKNTDYKIK